MINKFSLKVLNIFFGFKGGAFYRELIMGFNFSHPQKSGGAMAPLAPPPEGAMANEGPEVVV